MTSDLSRRVWEHKTGLVDGFTKRYDVYRLVYAEFHATMMDAILREKRIKKWRRAWKITLIEAANSAWRDSTKTWDDDIDRLDPRFRGGDEKVRKRRPRKGAVGTGSREV